MKLKLHFFATAITALILSGCGAPSTAPDPVVDASEAERVRDAGPTAPLSTDPETVSDTRKIVMLGDSLTAGFGLPPSDALPDQLERLLIAQDYAVEFVNAGVSGDTSAGGLARYDWSVASVNPDILVVALGANDYLSGLDPDQTRANLTAIIERAQAADIPILLVSLSARSSEASDPRAAAFAEIYPDLASTHSIPLYEGLMDPIFDKPEFLMPDGLHPTAPGVGVIAQPLADMLAMVLSEQD